MFKSIGKFVKFIVTLVITLLVLIGALAVLNTIIAFNLFV